MRIGGLILAAGDSTRLGQPKQLLAYQGETLVRRIARAALRGGCSPVTVVVGRDHDAIAAELKGLAATLVENRSSSEGIGSSIRIGLGALNDCDAIVVLACDQPLVDAEVVGQLIAIHRSTGQSIVASHYANTLGIPALFTSSHFQELASLGGDQGAKKIIATHPEKVARFDFPGGVVDVDTRGDYENLPNDN